MTSGAKLSISPSVGGALTLDFDSRNPDLFLVQCVYNKGNHIHRIYRHKICLRECDFHSSLAEYIPNV